MHYLSSLFHCRLCLGGARYGDRVDWRVRPGCYGGLPGCLVAMVGYQAVMEEEVK